MRISLHSHKWKLYFWVPNAMIHWKWLWKQGLKTAKEINYEEILLFLPLIKKTLDQYKRKYGHINIIDVKTKTGIKVKIRY